MQLTEEQDNGIGTAPSVTGSIFEGDSNGTDVSGNDNETGDDLYTAVFLKSPLRQSPILTTFV